MTEFLLFLHHGGWGGLNKLSDEIPNTVLFLKLFNPIQNEGVELVKCLQVRIGDVYKCDQYLSK